jgi:hypothetical protein
VEPCKAHLIILNDIYLCPDASQGTLNRACENMTRYFTEEDNKVKKMGVSEIEGPCPACEAAENAVQEACLHTEYVCCPSYIDRISN